MNDLCRLAVYLYEYLDLLLPFLLLLLFLLPMITLLMLILSYYHLALIIMWLLFLSGVVRVESLLQVLHEAL